VARFTGAFFGLKFAKAPFSKKVDEAIKVLIRNAAREWLRAMIVRIPVWTGQARGAVKFARGPNGNLAKYLNVSIPIVPRETRKGKNAQTGGRQGQYTFRSGQHVYRFFFRSDVIYYIHNDFFVRHDADRVREQIRSPWRSLETGSKAFEEFLERNKKNLPRIQDAITKVEITIG
jgi:hypothetical protein